MDDLRAVKTQEQNEGTPPPSPQKRRGNKTYVIPEMTVDDVLEAITDWIKKHPERLGE